MNPCTPSWTESADTILLEFETGRLRRLEVAGIATLAAAAGWMWLGASGLALVVLWFRARWPLPDVVRYQLDARRVRLVSLGVVRVRWTEGWFKAGEVFSDEIDPADFAALRRFLKAAVRDRTDQLKTG
jgi:hypothetical protein